MCNFVKIWLYFSVSFSYRMTGEVRLEEGTPFAAMGRVLSSCFVIGMLEYK